MLKDMLIKYLEDQGLYHESDDILIDELVFNIEILNKAKKDIRDNDIKIDVTKNPEKGSFYQKNPAISVYSQTLKQLTMIFRMLALSPSERQKLKIAIQEANDQFEDTFN